MACGDVKMAIAEAIRADLMRRAAQKSPLYAMAEVPLTMKVPKSRARCYVFSLLPVQNG
jgi:hypothetical protein